MRGRAVFDGRNIYSPERSGPKASSTAASAESKRTMTKALVTGAADSSALTCAIACWATASR